MSLNFDLYLFRYDSYEDPLQPDLLGALDTNSYVVNKGELSCKKTASHSPMFYKWSDDDYSSTKSWHCGSSNSAVETKNQQNTEYTYSVDSLGFSVHKDWLLVENTKPRYKKPSRKVTFADDAGMPLTTVCIISEFQASFYSTLDYLEDLKFAKSSYHRRSCPTANPKPSAQPTTPTKDTQTKVLKPRFQPPCSDYAQFQERLHRDSVVLESIKIDKQRILGTVRVMNHAFEKYVSVRCTVDSWGTYTDVPCTHVQHQGATTSTHNSHTTSDMFSFEMQVSPSTQSVEFAVQYKVQNKQYWDNNCGKNYEIEQVPESG